MKCQQYTEILNVYLDGELRDVPEAAVKHAEICADCRLLTQQLATLRSAARTLPPADLSESGQATIISGVQNRIAAMRSRKHILHIFGFSRFFAGLRWSRAFVAAALFGLLVLSYVEYRDYRVSLKNAELAAEEELEILLEEHALQTESGIFATGTVSTRAVLTAASNRR